MSISGDPILEELLLAHIEPHLQRLLREGGRTDGGIRQIVKFYRSEDITWQGGLRRYHMVVKWGKGSYYFDILKDGSVEC